MKLNTSASGTAVLERTHEGAVAARLTKSQKLRRLIMACLLWEDSFYVDGQSHAEYIREALLETSPEEVVEIAIEAREKMKLRHVPLLLVRELARHPNKEARQLVSSTLQRVIQRPDEIAEFLAIYWKDGKEPLSAQVKKGLAKAFGKFDEYAFSKWQKPDATIKLRDVMFLAHPKPSPDYAHPFERAEIFKKIADKTLTTPDTWEVALSSGADKKETWTRLLSEHKLGALALLRNLRNMKEAGVSDDLIRVGLSTMKTERVLPFRFISAAKYAPVFEPELESAMFRCLADHEKLLGKTVLLVDVSGSMGNKVGGKSELSRLDAATGLAMLLREICSTVVVYRFGTSTSLVPARRGFALRDAIGISIGGTDIRQAVFTAAKEGYDRLIVLTDEQSSTDVGNPLVGTKGYMINVATYQNGIGSKGWNRIDGWSEAIVDYIQKTENTGI